MQTSKVKQTQIYAFLWMAKDIASETFKKCLFCCYPADLISLSIPPSVGFTFYVFRFLRDQIKKQKNNSNRNIFVSCFKLSFEEGWNYPEQKKQLNCHIWWFSDHEILFSGSFMTRARKKFGPKIFHLPDVTPDKPEKQISPENPVSWNFGKKIVLFAKHISRWWRHRTKLGIWSSGLGIEP